MCPLLAPNIGKANKITLPNQCNFVLSVAFVQLSVACQIEHFQFFEERGGYCIKIKKTESYE